MQNIEYIIFPPKKEAISFEATLTIPLNLVSMNVLLLYKGSSHDVFIQVTRK